MPTTDHTSFSLKKKKTGNDRKSKIEPGQVHTERDCADTFTFKCNNEMQQEHFGDSRNLSMEGCLLFSFTKRAMELHSKGKLENFTEQDKEHVFHCHLSGDTSQNAATTHCCMKQLIDILIENVTLEKGSTIHDNSDGCAKQCQRGALQ